MKRVLVADGRSVRLVHLPGEHGVFEFHEYNSADDVRHYLERFAHDTPSVVQMRRALAEDSYGLDVPRMTDDEVFEEMSWRVVHRQFGIAEEIPDPPIVIAEAQEASSSSSEPPPLPKSQKKLTYIEFQVIWDNGGKPVKNVRLVVRTPDGVENFHDTNSEGKVRIDEIDPGSCDVRCDLKGAKLADTLDFVGMGGGGASGGDNGAAQSTPGTMRIAKIEIHKVKKSESIKGLATAAGMTWQELSKFNWGTDVPDEINKHLRDDVGCTKKTKDGYNYMFDDSDKPGLMYIPRAWSVSGLATASTHIIRVKQVKGGPLLKFVLESSTTGHLLPFHPFVVFDPSDKEIARGQTDDCAVGTVEVPSDGDYYVLPGDNKTFNVSGKVFRGSSTQPVKNGAVEILPWECETINATTGDEGELEINGVPAGELVIAHEGKEYHVVVSAEISDGFFFMPGVEAPSPKGEDHETGAEPASVSSATAESPEARINPEEY